MKWPASPASPANDQPAPLVCGTTTVRQAAPRFRLRHTYAQVLPFLFADPAMSVTFQSVPASVIAKTCSPGTLTRPNWAAVCLCQVSPFGLVHTRPVPDWAVPVARYPQLSFVRPVIVSPGPASPWAETSIQFRPLALTQMACGPRPTQPPGPPATVVA